MKPKSPCLVCIVGPKCSQRCIEKEKFEKRVDICCHACVSIILSPILVIILHILRPLYFLIGYWVWIPMIPTIFIEVLCVAAINSLVIDSIKYIWRYKVKKINKLTT